MKDCKLLLTEWVRPENVDIWYQMLQIKTGSHERTLGCRVQVTGHELRNFNVKHPSLLPRKFYLEKIVEFAASLLDHVERTIKNENRSES